MDLTLGGGVLLQRDESAIAAAGSRKWRCSFPIPVKSCADRVAPGVVGASPDYELTGGSRRMYGDPDYGSRNAVSAVTLSRPKGRRVGAASRR